MPLSPQPDFSIKVGDTAPPLAITCQFSDGSIQDLTGATVTFSLRSAAGATIITGGACTILTPTAGTVEYIWGANDTTTAGVGDFQGEFHATLASGKKETFPNQGYLWVSITAKLT